MAKARFTFVIEPELLEMIRYFARLNGLSVSAAISFLCSRAIKNPGVWPTGELPEQLKDMIKDT